MKIIIYSYNGNVLSFVMALGNGLNVWSLKCSTHNLHIKVSFKNILSAVLIVQPTIKLEWGHLSQIPHAGSTPGVSY